MKIISLAIAALCVLSSPALANAPRQGLPDSRRGNKPVPTEPLPKGKLDITGVRG